MNKHPLTSIKYRLRGIINTIKRTSSLNNLLGRQSVQQKYIDFLPQIEGCCGSISGKKILEVGCDINGQFLQYITSQRQVGCATGVNIGLLEEKELKSYSLLKADARNLPFPSNSYDLITSISAFEHIQDFDIALAEMHRVIRPGGYLFAEFAPIWSSVWGHHLWLYHGGSVKNWRNTPLPPYAHLLMTEDELRSWLADRYQDNSLTRKILEFVYYSDEQNRLFFSDYENMIVNSAFEKIFFVGFNDLPIRKGCEGGNFEAIMRKLYATYPDKSGFGYHGISMMLRK